MQFYSVSQTSLAKSGSSIVEEYIPLWYADGTSVSSTQPNLGNYFLTDGGSGVYTSVPGINSKLFSLNSNWSQNQKYAFEATIYSNNSNNTVYACLFDITLSSAISSSQVSTASTTSVVVRSNQFTLTPGHAYGVTIWGGGSSPYNYYVDASLIVFGQ